MRISIHTLTPEQCSIVRSPQRIRVLVAGRRWGKGVTARADLISRLNLPRKKYWYLAQSYGRVLDEYEWYSKQSFINTLCVNKRLQPYPHINLCNGVQIGFRSCDRPNNLVGSGLDGVYFDEAALAAQSTFTKIVRPLIADKRGFVFLTSTFRGPNWFYDLYVRGTDKKNHAHIKSWLYPTHTGYAFQSEAGKAELKAMESDMPRSEWEEECLCIPTAQQGAAFRREDIDACLTEQSIDTSHALYTYLGWDVGKAADPAAVVIMDSNGAVLHSHLFKSGDSYNDQLMVVSELADRYKSSVIVDSTGAGTKDAIIDFAREKISDVRGLQWKGRNQEQHCLQLELDLQNRKISIPKTNVELIRQLRLYGRNTNDGRVWYAAPRGDHDDLVAALVMANYVRSRGCPSDAKNISLSNVW